MLLPLLHALHSYPWPSHYCLAHVQHCMVQVGDGMMAHEAGEVNKAQRRTFIGLGWNTQRQQMTGDRSRLEEIGGKKLVWACFQMESFSVWFSLLPPVFGSLCVGDRAS